MKFTLLPGIRKQRNKLMVYADHVAFIIELIKLLEIYPRAYPVALYDALLFYASQPRVTRVKEMVERIASLSGWYTWGRTPEHRDGDCVPLSLDNGVCNIEYKNIQLRRARDVNGVERFIEPELFSDKICFPKDENMFGAEKGYPLVGSATTFYPKKDMLNQLWKDASVAQWGPSERDKDASVAQWGASERDKVPHYVLPSIWLVEVPKKWLSLKTALRLQDIDSQTRKARRAAKQQQQQQVDG